MPEGERTNLSQIFRACDALTNVFREFWPDTAVHILHRHPCRLLAGARYPRRALHGEGGCLGKGGSGVGYRRRGKPRRREPGARRVAPIVIGVLSIQAGAEDVGLDLAAHIVKRIDKAVDEEPATI